MPHFTYTARAVDGKTERGVLTAPSLEEARDRLRKRALVVEEIKQAEPTTPVSPFTSPKAAVPSWVVTDAPAAPAARGDAASISAGQSAQPSRSSPALSPVAAAATSLAPEYAPLTDTFRLFAGWLLAWYAIVFLLGEYQRMYALPYELAFIDNMFTSALVLRFAFATFLFLFLNTVHRWLRGGFFKGFLLLLLWVVGVGWFSVNT